MQTKKTNKVLVLFVLFLFLLCSVVGLLVFGANASSTTFTFSGELKESYKLNQVINVPTAKIGETQADFIIKVPDGTCSNKESYTLEMPGRYTIDYFATVNGKIYNTSKTFLVMDNYFTIEGAGTSEFRNYEYQSAKDGQKVAVGEFFTLFNGDSIVYNDVVDLSKFGPTDTLYKMSNIVSSVGEQNIDQFEVSLIDAYDESNVLTVRFKKCSYSNANDYTITYMDASFNEKFVGANMRGVDWKGDTIDTKDAYFVDRLRGLSYTLYKDENKNGAYNANRTEAYYSAYVNHERAGTSIVSSFTGGTPESPMNNGAYWSGLWYDVQTNIVYGISKYGENDGQVTRTMIADLENEDLFGEKFRGFTNNKVRIKITPTIFKKSFCNLFVQEVAGIKFSEGVSDTFTSSYSPEINIDFGEYSEETLPDVRKGGEYKIFNATAFDLIDGELPVKTHVYYGYNSAYKQQVQLTDGKFTAKHLGDYTIVYQATNLVGKTTEKIITIKSVDKATALDLIIEGEPDYTKSSPAGKQVKVLSDYQISNAFGNPKLSITAKLKADDSVSFDLNLENDYSFTPITSGEYEITFLAQDYSSTKTIVRTLNVVASDIIYYTTVDVFPEYLIQNGRYNLDVVESYTLNTGSPILVNTLLFVDKQNGEEKEPIDDIFTVDKSFVKNGKIKLVYMPEGLNIDDSACLVKEIPVIDAGLYTDEMNKAKYFVSTKGQFNFIPTEKNVECGLVALDNGCAKFTFANYLNANPFKIKLGALVKENEFVAFDKLNVYLSDPLNLGNYLLISLYNTSEGWFVSINGQNALKLSNTWGDQDDELCVNYISAKQKLIINNYFNYTDVVFFATQEPALFNQGVKLEVEIFGADGCDSVTVNEINDIVMDKNNDSAESKIDFSKDNNAGEHKLGEIITLLPFNAYNVFAPYLDVSVQAMLLKNDATSAEHIYSIDQIKLVDCDATRSYQFELKEYGIYKIQVLAKDPLNSNNNTSWDYSIIVNDYTKPEVDITGNKITNFKVGDNFSIPKFTVNLDDYNWLVVIKLPTAQLVSVTKDNVYSFTTKGTYKVSLLVYDTNYNLTEIAYEVNVE